MRHAIPFLLLAASVGCGPTAEEQSTKKDVEVPRIDWSLGTTEEIEGGVQTSLSVQGSVTGELPHVGEIDDDEVGFVLSRVVIDDVEGQEEEIRLRFDLTSDTAFANVTMWMTVDPETGEGSAALYDYRAATGRRGETLYDMPAESASFSITDVQEGGASLVEIALDASFPNKTVRGLMPDADIQARVRFPAAPDSTGE